MAALAKTAPKDAQVMGAILKDMGVADHEPRVINQMLEFTYRYVTDVLDDAKVYSSHAKKKTIDTDDVRLAVQCKLDHSFTAPPPKDLLLDIARHKNNTALPLVKPYTGPKLPPDRYCLCAPNYKLRTLKKQRFQMAPSTPVVQTGQQRISISGTSLPRSGVTQGLTLLGTSRGVTQPTMTMRPAGTPISQSTNPVPIIRLTSGTPSQASGTTTFMQDPNSMKRKRDDEDDYDM